MKSLVIQSQVYKMKGMQLKKMTSISLLFALFSMVLFSSCQNNEATSNQYDIIVYGGTSAGVMAAYTAKMKGKKVLLIEPGKHLGGLSSSGLGETDIGNKYTVSGLSRDFYRRLGKYYGEFEAWRFEPKVAESIFNQYIQEAYVEVLYQHRIISLQKDGTEIKNLTVEHSEDQEAHPDKTFSAKVFIDASYEGDLLGRADVTYTIGREGNAMYNETLNGVQHAKSNQIPDSIDPYIIPGDSTSGLIWGINPEPVAEVGSGDKKVQAYNYRLCLTSDTTNRIPISKPESYDPTKYEILRRIIKQRDEAKWVQRIHQLYLRVMPMPNQKTDINNKGGLSTDLIGASWEYPEATYKRRKEIEQMHREYTEGLLYFLAYDPDVPEHVKEQMLQYGWPKDEFTDNGGFPHQIYVREARRLVGNFVMTEHHCRGTQTIEDTIAMGAYNMDSHHGDRHVINGMVKNEGEVQEGVDPYAISYRVMLPKKSECSNLLVAACVSTSHIAYGSVRMEPVFMMLGQASGLAASMAIDEAKAVQEIDGNTVKKQLKLDPLVNGNQAEIVLNNEDKETEIIGNWSISEKKYTDLYFLNYLTTNQAGSEERKVVFHTDIPAEREYEIYFYITGEGRKDKKERAQQVPIYIDSKETKEQNSIDLSLKLESWVSLGKYQLQKGSFQLTVDASNQEKEVIADAVILIPQ
ncbi:MAG: FAD-dependent oxidoreductase [Bacteroidota bacterium]